jgi:hypothetical protein
MLGLNGGSPRVQPTVQYMIGDTPEPRGQHCLRTTAPETQASPHTLAPSLRQLRYPTLISLLCNPLLQQLSLGRIVVGWSLHGRKVTPT